jgi:hypothetical protein
LKPIPIRADADAEEVRIPRARTVFTKIEGGIYETPGYQGIPRSDANWSARPKLSRIMGLSGWMRACKDGAQTRPHSVNGLGVSGPISALRAIARRMSPCSRAGGTQMVGRPVERLPLRCSCHTRGSPRALAYAGQRLAPTAAGQSPPPRALIRATIEKGPAGGVLGIQSSTTNAASPIPYKNLCSSALAFQKSAKSPVNTDGTYSSRPDPRRRSSTIRSAARPQWRSPRERSRPRPGTSST